MVGKVFAVANEKGGVGKTTITVQLGHEIADRGKKVCIIDNDPSFDATTALYGDVIPESITEGNKPGGVSNTVKLYTSGSQFEPIKVKQNLFLMGSTDALSVLKNADLDPAYEFLDSVDLLLEEFDYIIIDCAPSFGLLFTAAMIAASSKGSGGGVLIPMIPDDLSFKAAKKVTTRIAQMNKRLNLNLRVLGVLANKVVNNPMPQSVRSYLADINDEFGPVVFNTMLHQTVKISDATSLQEKVADYARASSKAAVQITRLADEVLIRLEGGDGDV